MLDGAKKHFVFGYMRLPMNGDEVDIEQTKQMVDYFLEKGFNYFDTAHGYLEGKSEKAIKTCLADRHKRDEFILTNKLTNFYFKKEEDIRPLFELEQLLLRRRHGRGDPLEQVFALRCAPDIVNQDVFIPPRHIIRTRPRIHGKFRIEIGLLEGGADNFGRHAADAVVFRIAIRRPFFRHDRNFLRVCRPDSQQTDAHPHCHDFFHRPSLLSCWMITRVHAELPDTLSMSVLMLLARLRVKI